MIFYYGLIPKNPPGLKEQEGFQGYETENFKEEKFG